MTGNFSWSAANPLERHKGEPRRANDALQHYWAMGSGRSLRRLWKIFCIWADDETRTDRPPTRRMQTLAVWSSRHEWQARVDKAKELQDERFRAEQEEHRLGVLCSGFALLHHRVEALNRLAVVLEEEALNPELRWLKDVKQIGSGDAIERVDLIRFNAQLIAQYRLVLDDLAKELGERRQELGLTGSIGVVRLSSDDLAQAEKELADWMDEEGGS